MTAFFGKLGGYAALIGGFFLLILTFGRSKKKEGKAIEKSNQLGEALERIKDGRRISDQFEKDLANLSPVQRERELKRLRDKYTRD